MPSGQKKCIYREAISVSQRLSGRKENIKRDSRSGAVAQRRDFGGVPFGQEGIRVLREAFSASLREAKPIRSHARMTKWTFSFLPSVWYLPGASGP